MKVLHESLLLQNTASSGQCSIYSQQLTTRALSNLHPQHDSPVPYCLGPDLRSLRTCKTVLSSAPYGDGRRQLTDLWAPFQCGWVLRGQGVSRKHQVWPSVRTSDLHVSVMEEPQILGKKYFISEPQKWIKYLLFTSQMEVMDPTSPSNT